MSQAAWIRRGGALHTKRLKIALAVGVNVQRQFYFSSFGFHTN